MFIQLSCLTGKPIYIQILEICMQLDKMEYLCVTRALWHWIPHYTKHFTIGAQPNHN